jgi:undecaprenyl-diphosphatase
MSIWQAVVLGIVQGITEFLPISSTAHLKIVPALLGWGDPGAAYSAVIQLGTVAAVLVYFRRDLVELTAAFIEGLKKKKPFDDEKSRLAWFVGLGTIPIVVCGFAFKGFIKNELRSLWVISASMIALALVLLLVERLAKHQREIHQLTLKDGLIIGAWQALALIPGSSRSGTTITGGLAQGLKRADAARYSFLLSIPSTTLAGLYELYKDVIKDPTGRPSWLLIAIGTGVSFVIGMGAIAGLLRFLRTRSMMVFVAYRLALGLTLIWLLRTGALTP